MFRAKAYTRDSSSWEGMLLNEANPSSVDQDVSLGMTVRPS